MPIRTFPFYDRRARCALETIVPLHDHSSREEKRKLQRRSMRSTWQCTRVYKELARVWPLGFISARLEIILILAPSHDRRPPRHSPLTESADRLSDPPRIDGGDESRCMQRKVSSLALLLPFFHPAT